MREKKVAKKKKISDTLKSIGGICLAGIIIYGIGYKKGEKHYDKMLVGCARDFGKMTKLVGNGHKIVVTYF